MHIHRYQTQPRKYMHTIIKLDLKKVIFIQKQKSLIWGHSGHQH